MKATNYPKSVQGYGAEGEQATGSKTPDGENQGREKETPNFEPETWQPGR